MHRLCARLLAGGNDAVGQQVTFAAGGRADVDGFVGQLHMARVAVGVTDTEFAAQAVELITALGLQPLPELDRSAIDAEVISPEENDAPHAATEPEPDDWSNL